MVIYNTQFYCIAIVFFLSCHYTLFVHWKTHSFAVSLYSMKSSVVYSCGSIGHFSRWYIVCVCTPQSHMVSASLYFHFSMFDFQRPIPVLNLFRHLLCNHGTSDSGSRSSDGMDLSFCGPDLQVVDSCSQSFCWRCCIKGCDIVYEAILRIHQRHTKVHNYPQSNILVLKQII